MKQINDNYDESTFLSPNELSLRFEFEKGKDMLPNTLCQKPWECLPHDADLLQHRLCRKLFSEWYRIRADFVLS